MAVHHAQDVLLNIKAHRARNRIGHHQRRAGQEGLFGVGVDAAIEIAVAREHGSCVQVAVDDLLLDRRVERTAHAVAGGAGKANDAKTQLFEISQQAGLFEVQLDRLGSRRQRGFHPRLAGQAQTVGVAGQ